MTYSDLLTLEAPPPPTPVLNAKTMYVNGFELTEKSMEILRTISNVKRGEGNSVMKQTASRLTRMGANILTEQGLRSTSLNSVLFIC